MGYDGVSQIFREEYRGGKMGWRLNLFIDKEFCQQIKLERSIATKVKSGSV